MVVFTRKYDYDSDSSHEEITDEELVETYKLLHSQWKEASMVGEKHKKTKSVFLQEKRSLLQPSLVWKRKLLY